MHASTALFKLKHRAITPRVDWGEEGLSEDLFVCFLSVWPCCTHLFSLLSLVLVSGPASGGWGARPSLLGLPVCRLWP